jgi:hypothetical protein
MVKTVFKGVWFFSLIGLLAVFFYVYASLPESVVVYGELEPVRVSKELLFYISIALIAIWNVLVYLVPSLMRPSSEFMVWLCGLIICLNLFFIMTIGFINIFNSNERYDYSNMGFAVYGSLILLAISSLSWPFYLFFRKFSGKPQV